VLKNPRAKSVGSGRRYSAIGLDPLREISATPARPWLLLPAEIQPHSDSGNDISSGREYIPEQEAGMALVGGVVIDAGGSAIASVLAWFDAVVVPPRYSGDIIFPKTFVARFPLGMF
jgi:hypothetical protein